MNSTRIREVAAALRANPTWWAPLQRAIPVGIGSPTNEALGVRFGGLVVRPSGLPGGGRNWFGAGVSLTPDHLQACGVDGIAVRLFAAGGAVRIAGAGAPEECDDWVRDKWLGTDAAYAVEVAALGILDLSISESERLFMGRWPRRWFALAGVPDGKIGDPEAAAAVLEAIADWRIIIGRDGDGAEGLDVDVEDEGPDVVAAGEEHDAACGACGEAVSPAERHADHRLPIVVFEQQRREHAEHAAGPAGLSIH